MKLGLVVATSVLWSAAVRADEPRDLRGNARGLGVFADKVAQEFFDKWKPAAKEVTSRGLDGFLFPGGEACDVAQAAMSGMASALARSPDGKQLVAITSAKLDGKTAKLLGLKVSKEPETAITVVVGIDGPTAKRWVVALTDGGGCNRLDTTFTWSPDGKRLLAIGKDKTASWPHVELVDVAGHAVRYEGSLTDYQLSPKWLHIATRSVSSGMSFGKQPINGDELQIDGTAVWGDTRAGSGTKYSAVAWSSDTRLTFCGVTAKEPAAQYQVDLVPDDTKVTKLGACPAAKK